MIAAGVTAGFKEDLTTWSGPAIELAVEETKRYQAQAKVQAEQRRPCRRGLL